ncbi:MAG: acyl-[acyl-carrier-protein]--UDP-N-acetylglucosamine O-acyltransferase, partial [Acidobacteria bacterium]|nr:acyl-[acyl-carrier-protein]--UDP-N-acetylglucosamine O-acyltransferase [Acidobacteriota bacterium]
KKFSAQRVKALKEAYRWLFQKGLKLQDAIKAIRKQDLETEDVSALIQFVENSQRGFVRDVSSDG